MTTFVATRRPDLPIHLGSMPDAVRAVVAAFGADVNDGDVFIHNDPYFGGSHLPDVNVVRPAFYNGNLLGYACLRAHWPDVGSATPGSYGAVTEIYGELAIPVDAQLVNECNALVGSVAAAKRAARGVQRLRGHEFVGRVIVFGVVRFEQFGIERSVEWRRRLLERRWWWRHRPNGCPAVIHSASGVPKLNR